MKEGWLLSLFRTLRTTAFRGVYLAQLRDAIRQAGTNAECRVIILKSGGNRTFCAGASFDELMAISDFAAGKEFFLGFAQVINALRECPKFVIGSVQGKTIGGGVGLAAATDYCLATTFAAVKLSELAIGIGPFVVGPAVARKVGQSAFQQLAINATAFQTAEWAREKGLFAEVFPSIEELDAAVLKLAQQLAQSSPEAMKELKRISWEGTENWNELLDTRAAISGELVLSDFTRNAIAAFKNK